MLHLFISDVHLSPARPRAAERFRRFLNSEACKADALYILGDLFDLWIGDDAADDFQREQMRALLEVSRSGVELYLMHGNRDFLLGREFLDAVKAKMLGDPYHMPVNGQIALLTHGDTLCTRDHDYQDFRRMVRDPQWCREFLAQSVDERRALAMQYRTRSVEAAGIKAQEIMDVTPEAVVNCMREHDAKWLIHGHTHRPAMHKITRDQSKDVCHRFVLGAWEEEMPACCLRLNQNGFKLFDYEDTDCNGPI